MGTNTAAIGVAHDGGGALSLYLHQHEIEGRADRITLAPVVERHEEHGYWARTPEGARQALGWLGERLGLPPGSLQDLHEVHCERELLRAQVLHLKAEVERLRRERDHPDQSRPRLVNRTGPGR